MAWFGMNFTKPGPGVSKDEPEKNKFFKCFEILGRSFWKIMTLSLVYMLFCIPIITIGPATAAFCYVMRNIIEENPVFVTKDFFESFKRNFLAGFFVSLVLLVFGALLAYSLWFWNQTIAQSSTNFMTGLATVVLISAALIFVFVHFYVYTLISSFYFDFRQVIKNSCIFAISGLFKNLAMTVIFSLFVFILYIFTPILAILLLGPFFYFINYIAHLPIDKYLIQPIRKEQEEKEKELEQREKIFSDKRIDLEK